MIEPLVKIQSEDFDISSEIDRLTSTNSNIGAIVTFTGLCRDEGNRLSALELEHYPGMAERQIQSVAQEAITRFELDGISAIHRFGKIKPGDNIVLVVAAARHRQAAFDGANYLMDYLKTSAPFWKKEHLLDGSQGTWVDAKDADNTALDKWSKS
jgi:molybdopterin synthase catalytic subunit